MGVDIMKKILGLGVLCVLIISAIAVSVSAAKPAPAVYVINEAIKTSDDLIERHGNIVLNDEEIVSSVFVRNPVLLKGVRTFVVYRGEGFQGNVECTLDKGNKNLPKDYKRELKRFQLRTDGWFDCILPITEDMHGTLSLTYYAINKRCGLGQDTGLSFFANPHLELGIQGDLSFDNVQAGSVAYSNPILLNNKAETGSGAVYDLYVSGTDFTDIESRSAKCPVANHLKLSQDLRYNLGEGAESGQTYTTACDIDSWINGQEGEDNHDHFCYYPVNGPYFTPKSPNSDAEGYKPIVYGTEISKDFKNDAEILNDDGNKLGVGQEMALTFKLGLPEPCSGDFNVGQIKFWAALADNRSEVSDVVISTSTTPAIIPDEHKPEIWKCDSRIIADDIVYEGRGNEPPERMNNYAFEGEKVVLDYLVFDRNGIEEIQDVFVTFGSNLGAGNDIEVNCVESSGPSTIPVSCNARIGEEPITEFNKETMAYDICVLTVETPDSMHGEYYSIGKVISVDGYTQEEDLEYYFFNPEVKLDVEGDLSFDNIIPGEVAYSEVITVKNGAEQGSGVLQEVFISGTDFYDATNSGARCPEYNHLKLSQDVRSTTLLGPELESGPSTTTVCDIESWIHDPVEVSKDNHDHFCYYAVSGAYDTANGDGVDDNADNEGYRPIVYGNVFTRDFYNDAEIISNDLLTIGSTDYDAGNVLPPEGKMDIKFKFGVPDPCMGDFSTGEIFFWGQPI